MFRRPIGPAATIALAGLSLLVDRSDGAAQAPLAGPTIALAVEPVPATARALKPAYRIRLVSTWPQTASGRCMNGGDETLDGSLVRAVDGSYAGTFVRRTHLLFCGAHGLSRGDRASAPIASCALTLEGSGNVAMTGAIVGDDTSPSGRSARVTWSPLDGGKTTVTGDCPAAFKAAVATMYRNTVHGVEFPLTTAGEGPRTERLENYAWQVELE